MAGRTFRQVDVCMDGGTDGRIEGREWMGQWMDESMPY